MAQPGLKTLLLDRDPATPASMPEDVRYLLDHLATAAALLADSVDAYEGLRARRDAGEDVELIRAEAVDHAERIAAVLQSLGRRRDLAVAAQDTPLNPTSALAVLDQVFCSLCLLAADDDLTDSGLDEGEAARWIDTLGVEAWTREVRGAH
jgi:hypothetical protein